MEQIQLPKVKKRRFKRFLPLLLLLITIVACFYLVRAIKIWRTASQQVTVRQLCEQLVTDLKTDTANLTKSILFDSKLLHKNDSLRSMLLDTLQKPDSAKIRRLVFSGSRSKVFQPTMRGILQIQNKFYLKEVSHTKIPQYIADYQNSLDTLRSLTDFQLHDLNTDMLSFFKAHFAKKNNNSIYASPLQPNGNKRISNEDLENFNASMSIIEDCNNNIVRNSIRAKNKAARLIAYVKKLYRL